MRRHTINTVTYNLLTSHRMCSDVGHNQSSNQYSGCLDHGCCRVQEMDSYLHRHHVLVHRWELLVVLNILFLKGLPKLNEQKMSGSCSCFRDSLARLEFWYNVDLRQATSKVFQLSLNSLKSLDFQCVSLSDRNVACKFTLSLDIWIFSHSFSLTGLLGSNT